MYVYICICICISVHICICIYISVSVSVYVYAYVYVRIGSQAFYYALGFNANIGAWNIASVSNMNYVCAAFLAWAARHRRRDALGRVFDAARAVARGGAADALSLSCVCADVWALACAGVHVCRYSCAYERRDTCTDVYICVCIQSIYRYVFIYLCKRWVWACIWLHRLPMHTCVRLRAPKMRPLPFRVCGCMSAGIYRPRTRRVHIYIDIYRCRIAACKCVRV